MLRSSTWNTEYISGATSEYPIVGLANSFKIYKIIFYKKANYAVDSC